MDTPTTPVAATGAPLAVEDCPPDEDVPVLDGPTGAWKTKERLWIPNPQDREHHAHRTLVICFDGTGDRFDDDNSNIVQLVSFLKKDDASKQMVYYQTGIGTSSEADARFDFVRTTNQVLDLMFATTLGHQVRQGYEFLCQNYQQNDVICIFGFSRGAYTARALAGMVQKVGVLPPWNTGMIPFAYQMYSSSDPDMLKLAPGFKSTFCTDVKIEFVGVWDTVASVGLIPRYLPFVSSNSSIRYFRHAVALDEHRVKFVPNYYRQSRDKDQAHLDEWDLQASNDGGITGNLTTSPEATTDSPRSAFPLSPGSFPDLSAETAKIAKSLPHVGDLPNLPSIPNIPNLPNLPNVPNLNLPDVPNLPNVPNLKKKKGGKQHSVQYLYENQINKKTGLKTNALEVWFAGAHCDVGGGAVPNHTRHSLARIPLRWMIRECFRCQTGIIFDAKMLRDEAGMDIDLENLRILEQPQRLSPDPSNPKHRIPTILPTLKDMPFVGNVPLTVAKLPFDIAKGLVSAFFSPITSLITPSDSGAKLAQDYEIQLATREPFKGEAMEELLDAVSPSYDQLELAPSWWFIEFLPLRVKKEIAVYMSSDATLSNYTWLQNRGEGRKIFKHVVKRGMKVHRSVLTRLEALDEAGRPGTYQPWVRPNFVKRKKEKGIPLLEDHIHCRRMTNEEWITQKTEKLKSPWFQWV